MSTTSADLTPVEQIYQDPEAQREFREQREAMEKFFASLEVRLSTAPVEALAPREIELRWLETHPEVLTEQAGKWIALEGAALIAADASLSTVMAIARGRGIRRPFVMFIPLNPRDIWLGMSNQRIE